MDLEKPSSAVRHQGKGGTYNECTSVDGFENAEWHAGQCWASNRENNPWVRVDLGNASQLVEAVRLWNRDYHPERSGPMNVFVGDDGSSPDAPNNTFCGEANFMLPVANNDNGRRSSMLL